MSVDTNKNMDKNWVESEIATCSKGSSSSEKDNKKEKEQKNRGTIIMVLVALLAILLILLTLMKLPEQYINFKDTVIWQLTYTEMPDDNDFNSNQIDVNIQYIEDNAFSVSYRDTFADADGNSKSIYRFGIIDGATMYHIMQEADKIDVTDYVDRHDSTGGQTSFRLWNQNFDGTTKYNFMVYNGTKDETRAEIMNFMEYIEKVDKKVGTFQYSNHAVIE